MSIIFSSIQLLFIFSSGILLSILLGVKNKKMLFGLGFILGSWMITLLVTIFYCITNNFSIFNNFSILASLNIILAFLIFKFRKVNIKKFHIDNKSFSNLLKIFISYYRGFSKLELVLIAIITILISYTFFTNFIWPISDWDAIALYDFRANLINEVGNWNDGIKLGYFFHYPPYTSVLHGIFYQLGFYRVKIFYSLLTVSFSMIFYELLRKKIPRNQALIGVLLLIISPSIWEHTMMAYTNLPYVIFFCLSVLFSLEFLFEQKKFQLILSLIFLSATIWVRQSEPFWLLVIFLNFYSVFKTNKKHVWLSYILGLVFFFISYKYWPLYVQYLNLPPEPASMNDANYSLSFNLANLIHNLFLVIDYLIKSVVKPYISVFLIFFTVLYFDFKITRNKYLLALLLCILLIFLMIFLGTLYFSFTYKSWNQIGDSVSRLSMVLIPLIIFIIINSNFLTILTNGLKKN